jgi:hypothetical protein
VVTVDASGAEIVDLAGLQVRQRAIDQAAVGQLATGIEVGRTLAGDLTRGCVGDVLGVEVEVATAHDTLVVEAAGQVQRQRAVGDPFATMAHALLQGKAEVTLRMYTAVFAEHTCTRVWLPSARSRPPLLATLSAWLSRLPPVLITPPVFCGWPLICSRALPSVTTWPWLLSSHCAPNCSWPA